MDQFPLHMAIAFFVVQVAAWAGVCLYLRISHQRRAQRIAADVIAELQVEAPIARAA